MESRFLCSSVPAMTNIAIILSLLVLPYLVLMPMGIAEHVRGRIGIALVFAFTGLGHFLRTEPMAQMLPAFVPRAILMIYITGVIEFAAAVAVLVPTLSRYAGIGLCLFLLAVLPSNIYAAMQRIDFGGHAAGPMYLLVRVPLQFLLIGWVYWFTIRPPD